jgi:hypothetical protein
VPGRTRRTGGADEAADRGVVTEVAPAEDRAEQAQPPRVLAPELDRDAEGLVVGEEPVLRGKRLASEPDLGRRSGAEVADPVGA